MPTYSKLPLSQGSFGGSVTVSASAAPYTLIHTTGTSTSSIDEVYIYASNSSTADSNLTLYWGSSAVRDNILTVNVQAYGGVTLLIPGLILTGNGTTGSSIFTTTTFSSAVNITGYVNRITP